MSNKDFKVKNGIQPTVYHEAVGTVVSKQVGGNFTGATYDSVSFSVAAQTTSPQGMSFGDGGTKLYVIENVASNDSVYQYTLTTAYDISTASYASKSFDVSTQDATPFEVRFKPDGTKMYIVGNTADKVSQYTLSTAWDVSTASYDSVDFVQQDSAPTGLEFSSDGTKMYTIGTGADTVYQYTLTTAWDLSTAGYSSDFFSIASQDSTPSGVTFNSNGTKMYVSGQNTDTVYEYDLGTAWDVNTASYNSVSFSVNAQETAVRSVLFNSDDSKMYVTGAGTDTIYQYSTALNTAELDLSSGSVFDYTPTSDVQVTLTNPAASGTSSGATLLLGSEDSTGVDSTFSTTLYTGNSGTQTITNGIDLAGDGGMVWGKIRSAIDHHWIVDSENGIGSNGTFNYLEPSLTTALRNFGDRSVKTFNNDGFTLANSTNDQFNLSSATYVSWTFKKQTKFFDIVTYTGNGTAGTQIAHGLGSVPGMIIFKKTSASENWAVYHRGANGGTDPEDYRLELNENFAQSNRDGFLNDTAPTATHFTVGDGALSNTNNETYVAYLFAHDTDASSLIKCGSYTGNSTAGHVINLGFEAQWVLVKNTSATESWIIYDVIRGMPASGNGARIRANDNGPEESQPRIGANSQGFQLNSGDGECNISNNNYIYMAIRSPYIPTITYDPDLQWSGGTAPTAPATGETDVITFNTTDGGTTYKSALAIDGAK
jgi:6-phosphogluconolactonase (cycloisomerase 2 family)